MTQPSNLQGHSDAWYRERDSYIRKALRDQNDDWTTFDADEISKGLLLIQRGMVKPAEEYHKIVSQAIVALIQRAADGHATQCEKNGTLGDR